MFENGGVNVGLCKTWNIGLNREHCCFGTITVEYYKAFFGHGTKLTVLGKYDIQYATMRRPMRFSL